MFGQGNLEYSSTITNKYLFFDEDGKGPLKSTLILSNGRVALIRRLSSGLKKDGLSSAQTRHEEQTLRTSSVENGKFFMRTKCRSLVTPGWQRSLCIFISLDSVTVEAQKARVDESGAAFAAPGRYLIV